MQHWFQMCPPSYSSSTRTFLPSNQPKQLKHITSLYKTHKHNITFPIHWFKSSRTTKVDHKWIQKYINEEWSWYPYVAAGWIFLHKVILKIMRFPCPEHVAYRRQCQDSTRIHSSGWNKQNQTQIACFCICLFVLTGWALVRGWNGERLGLNEGGIECRPQLESAFDDNGWRQWT